MAYDFGASYYHTVLDSQIERVCPKEWATFKEILDRVGEALGREDILEQVARHYSDELDELDELDDINSDDRQALIAALTELCSAFKATTGLGLVICWVSEGHRGSDVSEEVIWGVSGVTALTPEAEKFEDKHGPIATQWYINGG